MNCQTVTRKTDDYLFGRLDDLNKTEFEQHISGCSECREQVEIQKEWFDLLSSDEIRDPGEQYWDSFEDRLFDRIESSNQNNEQNVWEKSEKSFKKYIRQLISVAAVMTLFVGLTSYNAGFLIAENDTPMDQPSKLMQYALSNRIDSRFGGILSPPGGSGLNKAISRSNGKGDKITRVGE